MARLKPRLVAFKVEDALADLLDRLPNKSDFIRRAVLTQLGGTCPLCFGAGIVPTGVAQHYSRMIEEHGARECDHCGESEVIPSPSVGAMRTLHPAWDQFFLGGPFYCPDCYDEAYTCEDCGWRFESTIFESHRETHKC